MDEYNNKIYLYDDGIGSVAYVDHMGTDLTIVNAARVSYGNSKSELDNRDKRLIKYLIRHRHTSTLEHNTVTLKFVVPLYVRSQHHRHRTWSYNEISRRYTAENLSFYLPEKFRTQHKSNKQASNQEELVNPVMFPRKEYNIMPSSYLTARDCYLSSIQDSLRYYDEMMKRGVCREQARGILPQCLYTEYYGTCNLNNLLKFIDLRLDSHAQWEIQQVGKACLEIATDLWPNAVQSYREIKYGNKQAQTS
tara:strand:- start:1229 stop:1978 length:750 start_codon:yes stop_codon:yes gene_type:complete